MGLRPHARLYRRERGLLLDLKDQPGRGWLPAEPVTSVEGCAVGTFERVGRLSCRRSPWGG